MVKVLVVEDDGLFVEQIISATIGSEYFILGSQDGSNRNVPRKGTDAIKLFDSEKPDIALIDIELMNSPINGIAVAEYIISKRRIPFAFVTRHISKKSPYFLKTIPVQPNMYLPKTGVASQEILHAFDFLAALKIYNEAPVDNTVFTTAGLFVSPVNDKFKNLFVPKEEIIYITVEGGVGKVYPDTNIKNKDYYLRKNFYFLIEHPLDEILSNLNFSLLAQIHRSHAVNLKYTHFESYGTQWPGVYDYKAHITSYNIEVAVPVGRTYRSMVNNIRKGKRY